MPDEHTSPDIAAFAASVLTMDDATLNRKAWRSPELFRAMAASLLTQAPDAKPKAKRAPRQPKS